LAKRTQSLSLNRETVRTLTAEELGAAAVHGGGIVTQVVILITEVQAPISNRVHHCPEWYCAG